MDNKEFARDLMNFIDNSPTAYQAVEEIENRIINGGFTELNRNEKWNLVSGGKYYIKLNDSGIISFVVGSEALNETGFRMLGAHTDSPGFKIKPNSTMVRERYIELNTEVYGGPILGTWYDRPLSIAGRVMVKGEDLLSPKTLLVNIDKDLLIIPSLAKHMNREVNDGVKLNPQNDTLPIVALSNNENEEYFIEKTIAAELDIDIDEILDYDLYLYDRQKGTFLGANEEFISIGRLDNLAMAHASIRALVDIENPRGTTLSANFDNEEIGSGTVQGASSVEFGNILKRISLGLGLDDEEHLIALSKSFMVSADMAHAVHPNYAEKADPTNRVKMGCGPAIKTAANKSYSSDGYSSAILKRIMKEANIPHQDYTNRSDMRGGGTIGKIVESFTGIKNIDVGNPMLSMHSVRELAAVADHAEMYKAFCEFLKI
ncbi:MAG: M18 family aminopeptidase [Tissierellia bacterium]|nr:M18 family aminopeptidase [Tissierellia bacterium]